MFSTDGSTIDEQVGELLRDGRRIALAESCTAGLLAARLAEPPGASSYLAGGVVAYSNEAKVELLGVPPALIEEHGAVSPEVAAAMADGAIARFGADLGVGITGIAGPDGGTEEKPVGYVCVCVKVGDGPMIARDPVIPGDRVEIKRPLLHTGAAPAAAAATRRGVPALSRAARARSSTGKPEWCSCATTRTPTLLSQRRA